MGLNHLISASNHGYVSPFLIATASARLGHRDQALAWLAKAYQNRSTDLVLLKVEPAWDNFRSDPRYLEVEHDIGFAH